MEVLLLLKVYKFIVLGLKMLRVIGLFKFVR